MNVPARKKTDRRRPCPCSCTGCLRGIFRTFDLHPGPKRTYDLMLVKLLASFPAVQEGSQKNLRFLPVEIQGKMGSFLGLVNKKAGPLDVVKVLSFCFHVVVVSKRVCISQTYFPRISPHILNKNKKPRLIASAFTRTCSRPPLRRPKTSQPRRVVAT